MILLITLVLLYVAIRAVWYLIPEIKSPPAGTGPGEKAIAADRKTAEKERKAAKKAAEKERKAADRIQLLDMDIRHYTGQYEQLERIQPKNLKQEIAIEQRKYQVERKIAAAALEMDRLQTPD